MVFGVKSGEQVITIGNNSTRVLQTKKGVSRQWDTAKYPLPFAHAIFFSDLIPDPSGGPADGILYLRGRSAPPRFFCAGRLNPVY